LNCYGPVFLPIMFINWMRKKDRECGEVDAEIQGAGPLSQFHTIGVGRAFANISLATANKKLYVCALYNHRYDYRHHDLAHLLISVQMKSAVSAT
jgi:hypothetical protein